MNGVDDMERFDAQSRGAKTDKSRTPMRVRFDHQSRRPSSAVVQIRPNLHRISERTEIEQSPLLKSANVGKNTNINEKCCASCLLLGSADQAIIQNNLGIKCQETFWEQTALNAIKDQLKKKTICGCEMFKHMIVDLDCKNVKIVRLVENINKIFQQHPDVEIKIYAFMSNLKEFEKDCKQAGVKPVTKPAHYKTLKALLVPDHLSNNNDNNNETEE